MKLLLTGSHNPFFNLAAEEIMLREETGDFFMLWQNEPSVIIGKNQNYYAEVCEEAVEELGVHVARRITGGGAVYHDLGNINYSFITSEDKADILDFSYFTKPIVDALSKIGLSACLSGRNDLLLAGGDGELRKFSGNAEAKIGKRILHHGTLLFDSDLSVMPKVLRPDDLKLKSKGIKSVRSRVVNLRDHLPSSKAEMTTADFFEYLVSYSEDLWGIQRETVFRERIRKSPIHERNRTADYNKGRKKHFDFEKKEKFSFGLLLLLFNLTDGKISDFRIEGDFFGEADVTFLADIFPGLEYSEEKLSEKLKELSEKGTPVSRFIAGCTETDFLKLLFKE